MSNPVAVHWFTSDMSGAPALSGEAGKLIGVLDACLINGFGSVTLDSLVIADSVATATYGSGHGFLDHTVVLIEGATPSGANGEKRITRVSSSVFTFDATGISNQTATGTITAKMAPVGWVKSYSGTNKAAYARTALAASAMLLRVDDTPAQYPTLIMYETMSNVDTGTGPAPTTGSCYTNKSNTANSTARPWRLFADDRAFYLHIMDSGSTVYESGVFFGDINSYLSSDAYHCGLSAHLSGSQSVFFALRLIYDTEASFLARSYTQIGIAVAASRFSHRRFTGFLGYVSGNTLPYPALVDNGFHAWPVEVWEGLTIPRGMMPGLWGPVHDDNTNLTDGLLITDIPQLPGRVLMTQTMATGPIGAYDLTGPWRE